MPTISIAKGTGYARHNDRTLKNKTEERSWDPDKTDLNITYKNEPVREAYERIFGSALKEYNQSQVDKGRSDRQIDNYYEKISRSKQEKTCYEFIIQIGNIEDKQDPDKYQAIQKALDDYNKSFQGRNKNFEVFQQITHRDEKGMDHTHIMIIPVSHNNKRGLETKNSLSGALKEMGYGRNGFDQWREHELDTLIDIMREHGLEFEQGDGRQEHLNVRQYREYKKYEEMTNEIVDLCQNTVYLAQENVSKAKNELSELEVGKKQLQAEISVLEAKKEVIEKNPSVTVAEDPKIVRALQEFAEQSKSIKIEKREEFSNDYTDDPTELITDKLDDSMVTFKGFRKDKIEMSADQWEKIKNSHNNLVDTYKKIREVFMQKAEILIDLFNKAKSSPVEFSLRKYEKLKEKCSKLIRDSKIFQNQRDNFKYDLELKEKDNLTFIRRAVNYIDDRSTDQFNLEDFSRRTNYDLGYLISQLPKEKQEKYYEPEPEIKRTRSKGWDWER